MSMQTPAAHLTMQGRAVDTSPAAFGELWDSLGDVVDMPLLRGRMNEDGYLFFRGYFDVDKVLAARREVCERLAKMGMLDESHPLIDAISRPDTPDFYSPDELVEANQPLLELLYDGPMITFYERFLGRPVRHFDYTWFRTHIPGGKSTLPHCDRVYMGRGTADLYTSWTPIGDAPLSDGPLAVIPRSHRIEKLQPKYFELDVDAVCTNRRGADGRPRRQSPSFGYLSKNPVRLRANLGLPFLTTDFRAGDLLVFTTRTLHCSFDNHGRRIRLSTDTRYQAADEPIDDRWGSIDGRPPVRHGDKATRELIC